MAQDIEGPGALTMRYRPIGELTPDPRNARTHPKRQIEQLQASIREFGFTNPVLADPEGNLIAGHGRLIAARTIGMTEVPVIELPGLTEVQKRALRIADNKIALNAGWDLEILQSELSELSAIDVDIEPTLTGFTTGEIDVILDGPDDPDDEVIPAVPVTPRTRPGDVWVLGDHRIGCGDSRDLAFLERVIGAGAKIDAAFLDPPYNVRIDGNVNAKGRHREFAMASGEMTETEFRAFLAATLGAAARVSRDGAVHFVCMDWRHMKEIEAAGRDVYSDLKNLIIWVKDNGGMGTFYRSRHELIFAFKQGMADHINSFELGQHGRYRTNVWEYKGVNTRKAGRLDELELHPTVKPVQMIADAIKDVSGRNDIVLDLFGGSGSTLIAAHKTGRQARLCELDPLYCSRIIKRYEQYAKDEAIKIACGISSSPYFSQAAE